MLDSKKAVKLIYFTYCSRYALFCIVFVESITYSNIDYDLHSHSFTFHKALKLHT
jgi:hypothetical protein